MQVAAALQSTLCCRDHRAHVLTGPAVQCPHLTLLQPLYDKLLSLLLIVLVVAECICLDVKVLQQLPGMPGVLC